MKKILLLRHAKSSWAEPFQSDYDRPLNHRGNKDAPLMAARIHQKIWQIDGVISSPAVRAKTTAELFQQHWPQPLPPIQLVEELYHAPSETIAQVIEQLTSDWHSVLIVCHNPGITQFANELTKVRIDNMPTAGAFAVQADVDDWAAFQSAEKQFVFFDYPKSLGA